MEREVLFRGKHCLTDKYVYGYFSKINGNSYITANNAKRVYEVQERTVAQLITDSLIGKLFEGDIIQTKEKIYYELIYSAYLNGYFAKAFSSEIEVDINSILDDAELVGNIFDNKTYSNLLVN